MGILRPYGMCDQNKVGNKDITQDKTFQKYSHLQFTIFTYPFPPIHLPKKTQPPLTTNFQEKSIIDILSNPKKLFPHYPKTQKGLRLAIWVRSLISTSSIARGSLRSGTPVQLVQMILISGSLPKDQRPLVSLSVLNRQVYCRE
jgi:hypothetical protein